MSQQRLEGPDLEELLAKVRKDFGEEATIIEANRLRKGGVGGFFAKETYEVVLDLPEESGRDEMAYEVPADEEEEPAAQEAADDFVPFTLDELATRIDDPVPDFAASLAAAMERTAPAEPAWPAQTAIAEVEPVIAASPKIARLVAGGLDGIPAPVMAPAEPPATIETTVIDVAEASEAPEAPEVPEVAEATHADEAPAHDVLAYAAALYGTEPAAPLPAPIMTISAEPMPMADEAIVDPELAALSSLGVPIDRLALPHRTDEPAAIALVRLLECLPAAPPLPRSTGGIIAVIGDRARALDVAASLDVDAEVLVASRRRGADVRTPAEADERRRAWRRRKRPTVVVIDSPFGVTGDSWASDVIGALEPVIALGHVDAGRKPEDVLAWVEGLGGLDALAVDGLATTTTPAAVLGVGLPVAMLDGAPATPTRWAAILTDRMAAMAA